MTRILIVWPSVLPPIGGVASHIRDMSKGLRYFGIDVKVLSASPFTRLIVNGPSFLLRKLWPGLGMMYYFAAVVVVYGLICNIILRLRKYDCLLAQHPLVVLPILRSKGGPRIVQTIHTYMSREHATNRYVRVGSITYLIGRALERKSYEKSDAIVAVDNRLSEYVTKEFGIDRDRVTTVLNATDTNRFAPVDSKTKKELRRKLGIHEDRFVVLCPRRLVEKCGVIYPAMAIKQADKEIRNQVQLIYAGDGPERDSITRIVSEGGLSNVSLLGTIPHHTIDEYYKASDVVIVPSVSIFGLEEASSISAIEAMACGLPVIASNIGGLKDIIVHNVNGLLVEQRDVDDIIRCMRLLLTDNEFYNRISEEARHHAIKCLSYQGQVARYLEIMKLG